MASSRLCAQTSHGATETTRVCAPEATPEETAHNVFPRELPRALILDDGTRAVQYPEGHPFSWPGYRVVEPPYALEGGDWREWYVRLDEDDDVNLLWAIRDIDGVKVVLKVFEGSEVESGEREATAMHMCAHPGVLPLLGVLRRSQGASIYGVNAAALVMPCAERVFWDPFSTEASVPEKDVMSMVHSIASALEHVHGVGYAHCDVKGDNVFFLEGRWVLGDFGSASKGPWGPEFPVTSIYTVSPEMVAARRERTHYDGFKHDVWALGVTALSAFVCGKLYPCVDSLVLECIARGHAGVIDSLCVEASTRAFLEGALDANPERRSMGPLRLCRE